mmetsp:Transcript_28498/g.61076  ORF Transcript_28498/g.61076 Transcript_28498/m.61076 type:complete len:247 (+) Transcript_28498:1531-2271(+)
MHSDRCLAKGAVAVVAVVPVCAFHVFRLARCFGIIVDAGHGGGRQDRNEGIDREDRLPRGNLEFQEEGREQPQQDFFRQVQKGKVSRQLRVRFPDGSLELGRVVLARQTKVGPLGRPQKPGTDSTDRRTEVGSGYDAFFAVHHRRHVKAPHVGAIAEHPQGHGVPCPQGFDDVCGSQECRGRVGDHEDSRLPGPDGPQPGRRESQAADDTSVVGAEQEGHGSEIPKGLASARFVDGLGGIVIGIVL